MTNWKSLFSLKYEDRDSFLHFHFKTKEIVHQLNKGNLITTIDGFFFKAYFAMVIEAKCLQHEVKGFLRDINTVYSETIELIYADFIVQVTGETYATHFQATIPLSWF